jgi:hypothetical protein
LIERQAEESKGIERADMKQLVIKATIKICGKSILLTSIIGIVVVVIGNLSGWNTALAYSNAFFVAGFFVIAGGIASRLNANQDTSQVRLSSSAESLRGMSMSERLDSITHSSLNLVIVCLLSGILLMLISMLIAKMH